MNKTIMCLINGLGIEQKNSCDAYTKEVMPNLEKMIAENLFTPLETPAYDYATGYQIFNTGTTESLTEDVIKKVYLDGNWNNAAHYQEFVNQLNSNENKLHIVCSLINNRTYDYLKSFVKRLNNNKKVIIHVLLKQADIGEYKLANKFLDTMKFDPIPNAEIGIICGSNIFTDDSLNTKFQEFCTILTRKVGGQWANPAQKFNIYRDKNILPINADPFFVSDNCNIENGDNILFFNTGDEDYSKLIIELTDTNSHYAKFITIGSFHFYALFPSKNINGILSIFDNVTSDTSLAMGLDMAGSKALVMVDQENYNTVRYMNSGLKNESSSNISYMIVDNNILFNHDQMSAIINNEEFQNIIINYRIDNCNDFETLQATLKNIDTSIAYIRNECLGKYRLIISSLFGYTREITKNGANALVNFNGKVPLVVIDNSINRSKVKLQGYANTGRLLPTFIKSIKPDLKINTLIVSKSFLTKILYK